MNKQINNIAKTIEPNIIKDRRTFHKYAEAGWTEYFTTARIIERLEELGYDVLTGTQMMKSEDRMGLPSSEILESHYKRALDQGANPKIMERLKDGYTGAVGVIKNGSGPTIALRFDIDAVEVTETSSSTHLPNIYGFTSINKGVMHACGHDGHAAIGLGVAEILSRIIKNVNGTVKLIFQPAEEGVRGAKSIATSRILDDVDYILGGHLGIKENTSGELYCNLEGFLATTKIDAFFKGVSTHAGVTPELGRNALLAAASATLHLSSIPRNGTGSTRINVGKLEGGSGRNVIPAHCHMQLETRGETSHLNEYMRHNAMNILESSASMYQVEVATKTMGEAKAGSNSSDLVKRISQSASKMSLFKKVSHRAIDLGGSEDFSYLLDRVQSQGGKGAYMLFGSNIKESHHHEGFDFEEKDLINIVEFLSNITCELLSQ